MRNAAFYILRGEIPDASEGGPAAGRAKWAPMQPSSLPFCGRPSGRQMGWQRSETLVRRRMPGASGKRDALPDLIYTILPPQRS